MTIERKNIESDKHSSSIAQLLLSTPNCKKTLIVNRSHRVKVSIVHRMKASLPNHM